ncbi:MAG: insulinase family protein [Saprospiraceae bacterium]|nr:insulinase family protein [Saprospiraceae bacterium]HQV96993.1 pitrilysin family protein [Saprospiraceae bacterium]
MIAFERIVLGNGLTVIIHEDFSTPMVAVNVVYNVGSKHEDPNHTGFAHLFEHLMFGGSKHIPDFDTPIQDAGGENNAFTNTDLTNFYEVLPAQNVETALWLESDRMLQLRFSKKSLNTQKKVVIEEFKETCLNEPYGDMWHHLSALCYTRHPYQWPTIGKHLDHIADATIDQVVVFFEQYYKPENAVVVLAGNITISKGFELVQKWFGDIPKGNFKKNALEVEPVQSTPRQKVLTQNVPHEAIYQGYHMGTRLSDSYYACDLLSDVLANGRSSRFYQKLYKEQQLFSTIDAFISGTTDPGLFIIEGKTMPSISIDQAKDAIRTELNILQNDKIPDRELTKLKNAVESSLTFSEVSALNKAISLAYFEVLGDANLINEEAKRYQEITADDLRDTAQNVFKPENCSEVIYLQQK